MPLPARRELKHQAKLAKGFMVLIKKKLNRDQLCRSHVFRKLMALVYNLDQEDWLGQLWWQAFFCWLWRSCYSFIFLFSLVLVTLLAFSIHLTLIGKTYGIFVDGFGHSSLRFRNCQSKSCVHVQEASQSLAAAVPEDSDSPDTIDLDDVDSDDACELDSQPAPVPEVEAAAEDEMVSKEWSSPAPRTPDIPCSQPDVSPVPIKGLEMDEHADKLVVIDDSPFKADPTSGSESDISTEIKRLQKLLCDAKREQMARIFGYMFMGKCFLFFSTSFSLPPNVVDIFSPAHATA